MGGLFIFTFIILFIGLILFVAALGGAFSGVTNSVSTIPDHNYTEEEFIALFNYCVNKRNAKTHETISIINNQKITNMDAILDFCKNEYEQDYHSIDLNDLCKRLLSLLTESEQAKINYGVLN
jgi:hypothetical protein